MIKSQCLLLCILQVTERSPEGLLKVHCICTQGKSVSHIEGTVYSLHEKIIEPLAHRQIILAHCIVLLSNFY